MSSLSRIANMMSESINIPLEFPAPLPWMPPTCKAYPGKTRHDKLPTLEKWTHISSRTAEREIEASYYKHSSEENFHEWGARVNSAMNMVMSSLANRDRISCNQSEAALTLQSEGCFLLAVWRNFCGILISEPL